MTPSRADALVLGLHIAANGARAAAITLTGRMLATVNAAAPLDALRQVVGAVPQRVIGLGIAADQTPDDDTVRRWLADTALPATTSMARVSPAAHAAAAGCGVAEPSTLVMLIDEPVTCMLNSRIARPIDGVTGPMCDAIVPGYHGYRFTLSSVTTDENRFALRRMVERMRASGVPVRRFVAAGDEAAPSESVIHPIADLLHSRVGLATFPRVMARGAAALAAVMAGKAVTGFASASMAIHAIADPDERILLRPDRRAAAVVDTVYLKQERQ